MSKTFIEASELLRDSYELGLRVIESGFRPTFLLGVWRGGTPVGIAMQELFEIYGLKMNPVSYTHLTLPTIYSV